MKHLSLIITLILLSCNTNPETKVKEETLPKAKVSYPDFERLVSEVKAYREAHLISLEKFLELSKTENTIILDTRSKEMYEKKHIKEAIHLNFSDFSQGNLQQIIPGLDTTILIYCNNNFLDDQIHFTSKVVLPKSIDSNPNEVSLALNIPTYINLYGYGYKNVYELSQLISVFNNDVTFEGTSIK